MDEDTSDLIDSLYGSGSVKKTANRADQENPKSKYAILDGAEFATGRFHAVQETPAADKNRDPAGTSFAGISWVGGLRGIVDSHRRE